MEYRGTLSSGQEWAQNGKLEEWVHAYLLSDGHNKPFSDGLKITERIFTGPVSMPLSLFQRCCGPEEHMTYRVDQSWWEKNVQALQHAIQTGSDLPPLIIHYILSEGKDNGEFELNDGNKRWEAYTRLGIEKSSVIFWFTERREHEHFRALYGQYLI